MRKSTIPCCPFPAYLTVISSSQRVVERLESLLRFIFHDRFRTRVFRDLSQDFGDIVAAASQIDLDDLPSTVNGVTDALKVIIDVSRKMQGICRRAKKDIKRHGSAFWSKLDAWNTMRRAV